MVHSASLDTKLMLFRAYCTPIYGCQLWCSMHQYSYNKLRVPYNDAFRQLLQEPRWCSASKLFVFNAVPSFPANVRKLASYTYCHSFLSVGALFYFSLFVVLYYCVLLCAWASSLLLN